MHTVGFFAGGPGFSALLARALPPGLWARCHPARPGGVYDLLIAAPDWTAPLPPDLTCRALLWPGRLGLRPDAPGFPHPLQPGAGGPVPGAPAGGYHPGRPQPGAPGDPTAGLRRGGARARPRLGGGDAAGRDTGGEAGVLRRLTKSTLAVTIQRKKGHCDKRFDPVSVVS